MSRNGFTLLELLVALAVFSIAALALLRLDSVALASAADLSAREGMMLVAENEAARLATDPGPLTLGETTRAVANGGRTFTLRQIVTPTPDPRLVRIDLLVASREWNATTSLTLIKRVQ